MVKMKAHGTVLKQAIYIYNFQQPYTDIEAQYLNYPPTKAKRTARNINFLFGIKPPYLKK